MQATSAWDDDLNVSVLRGWIQDEIKIWVFVATVDKTDGLKLVQ